MKRFTITSADEQVFMAMGESLLEVYPNGLPPEWGPHGTYTIKTENVTEELALRQAKAEARAYLAETDWYIIRQMDTGVACPPEVQAKRQEARLKL